MSKRRNYALSGEKFQTKTALHEHVRQMFQLERLCSRFHQIAQQLRSRHDQRETLRVEDEADLCDLLHALLILEHDDVRRETWTPSYANGRSRTDLLLKLERIVIIAKKAQRGWDTRMVEEQLIADLQKYYPHPDCRTVVCFIYDPDGQIVHPHAMEHELSGDKDELTVRVIIAPQAL